MWKQLARPIYNNDAQSAAGIDTKHECRGNTKEYHRGGQQNGRNDEHLRANASHPFPFNDCE
jgi:hypothetical protein